MLVVSFTDDVAQACRQAAREADVGFVRVSQGVAACRAVVEARPAVVALGSSLWSDEVRAVSEAARIVGARVIELPPFAPKDFVAYMLVRAALAER